jgi:hypothetical protein
MNTPDAAIGQDVPAIPNGSGAAAMLAAAMGCCVLGILALAGDKSAGMRNGLNFYKPTGPLSGVTTSAIAIWVVSWCFLEWRWRKKTIAIGRVTAIALVLLFLSFLLTFPPVVDFF